MSVFYRLKKVFLFILCSSIVLCFLACGSDSGESDSDVGFSNLREKASFYEKKTVWTEEIEKNRLTSNISVKDGINSKIKLTPFSVALCLTDSDAPVYPSLDGFGSLDTSLLDKNILSFLTRFAESFIEGETIETYFADSGKISLTLFYIFFDEIAENMKFSKDDGAGEKEIVGKTENKSGMFTEFFLGEPFIENNVYGVPVRFSGDSSFMNVTVYCKSENTAWKIEQIQITDWETKK